MKKRNTIQRQLVLHSVKRLVNHPTAEEVYKQIVVAYPGISKATVYRNLGGLVDDGLLQKLNVPGAADKYDISTHAHYHAICNVCGSLFDLEMDNPPTIDLNISDMKDFIIEEYIILFKGKCKKCKSTHLENTSNDVFDIQQKNNNKRREKNERFKRNKNGG